MVIRSRSFRKGRGKLDTVELWLDGSAVGTVALTRRDGPWFFGRFAPEPGFARFQNIFHQWSGLMDLARQRPLSEAERRQLAAVEQSIDRLRASVVTSDGRRQPVWQLNIDGDLIEWSQ